MEVAESRKWAVGLDSTEYVREYVRRHPVADSIPDQNKYIAERDPQYRGISAFVALEEDNSDSAAKQAKKVKHEKDAVCQGCGKTYTHPSAKFANLHRHQQHCQTYKTLKGG